MEPFAIFQEMKQFVSFSDADEENLKSLAPLFERRGHEVTDAFYAALGRSEESSKFIEGRVEYLRATHALWLKQLFEGEYGRSYFDRRMAIGAIHVRVGLPSHWCEVTMNLVRTVSLGIVHEACPDRAEAARKCGSLLKILDLDMLVITLAQNENRLERVAECSGLNRPLMENLVRYGAAPGEVDSPGRITPP